MPSITFIPNPVVGQEYTAENGQVYTWTGNRWQSNATTVSSSVTLPANSSGYLTNDGSGNLAWGAGDGTFSGDYNDLVNKPSVPDSTSQLTNDSGFITSDVTQNFVPVVDNAVDLGSPTNRFRHLYVAPGTIYLGDIKLSNLNGKLDAKKVVNPGEENEYEDTEDSDAFSPVRGNNGSTSLDGLSDTDISDPTNGQALVWNGENWTNQTVGGGNANTGNIVFEGDDLTNPTNQVINVQATDYAQLESNNNYLWVDNSGVHVEVTDGEGGHEFVFEHSNGTSKLRLPSGGDIVDSTGTSVLGGGGGIPTRIDNGMSTVIIPTENGEVIVNVNDDKEWQFLANGQLMFPDGTVQTTAYVTAEQLGFFTEFKHNGDNNRLNMEAVAMGSDGSSYVSYSYYSDNDNRNFGGIVKLSPAGTVVWIKDIASPNGNADYVKIPSLEFVSIPEAGSYLTAYGYYYDNNVGRDVGFNYFLNPETGDINNSFSIELDVNYATELSDGVFGSENGAPTAVLAGNTYGANLQKQFTILSPSTTDRVYISWEEYAASGLNPGDQVYYYVNGYYGMYINKFDCTAVAPGAGSPWDGLSLQVSVTKDGSNYSYTILRNNGWSGVIYGYPVPQTLTVPGSQLGGVDGVNDLTFDFDKDVFNGDSNNLLAAISNVQGTPYSDAVVCPAWNGKDWSTEIGNTLTFDYQLNRQALLTKIGGTGGWTKNIGATDYEQLESVTVDSSNNIYAVGYYWKTNKGSFVIKYDSTGNEQWAVHIDPQNNTGNTVYSVDMLSDGNIITVANNGIVTKLNSSDGSIMWQIMNDGNPNWDSDFKGTATPDGNYVFANYESNNYTMYVICVSGADGSVLWTKQISRNWSGQNGEIYPQNDYHAQYIDCNSTHVVVAGTSYIYLNNNGTYAGLVFSFPLDGQGVDGSYGQYNIQSVTLGWNTQSTTSTPVTVDTQDFNANTAAAAPTTSDPAVTVTKTNIGGGEASTTVAGIERHSASEGDNNITLAEEHNGKFLYYNGSNGNSWIYVPSNSDVNLPIGFTVTVVMDYFNGNRVYVNNNTGSQNATINASGFDYNTSNYWMFGASASKCGVYTIMKVDTDRWMLSGPDITVD